MPRTKEEKKKLVFLNLGEDYKITHARYDEKNDCFFFGLSIAGAFFNNLCFRYSKVKESYFLSYPSTKYEKDGETKYSPIYKLYLSDEDLKTIFRLVDDMTK